MAKESILLLVAVLVPAVCGLMSYEERMTLRDESIEMYEHSLKAYMENAFPYDELLPLSCGPRRWEHRVRGTLDDSLGGYMLTLVDGLDTLALMGNYEEFTEKLKIIAGQIKLNRFVTVSTFEASIRVLGGLLSLHTLVSEGRLRYRIFRSSSAGEDEVVDMQKALLDLARELGERLLPAFKTKTGLPYHLINLKSGIAKSEERHTCVAAAGTYILEFIRLSRLTGDPSFEKVARQGIDALWSRRSRKNLIGSAIDIQSGKWLEKHSGVGAGVDSFFEYIAKAALYLDDPKLKGIAKLAIETADNQTTIIVKNDFLWNVAVDYITGEISSVRISALQAFWPSLLALQTAGDSQKLEEAQNKFHSFWTLWQQYKALPDVYDLATNSPLHYGRDSPLRPELIESAYHLYIATNHHPHYLQVGKEILFALQNISRVPCGFAAIADVQKNHRLDNRMDSYFLAETLKYLFLLFDHDLQPHDRRSFFCADAQQCQQYYTTGAYDSFNYTSFPHHDNAFLREAHTFSTVSAPARCDMDSSSTKHCQASSLQDFLPHSKEFLTQTDHQAANHKTPRSALPPACNPELCIPMEDVMLTTEGHFFDLRHRPPTAPPLGPFASYADPNRAASNRIL